MMSTPCSTFLAPSSRVSVFVTPINVRQVLASLCTDSGCVIRNTAWRTSFAVNSPQWSWNVTPWRRVMVQVWPSGAISHFSASSGIYAPVCRSIPTRNSRAGLLSRLPLRGLSQVKLVSQPRGATAIFSRSNFAACTGVAVSAQATVATSPRTHITLTAAPLTPYLSISAPFILRCQLDVLQVGEVAGDHAWKHILRDILGVHCGFGEQPEHGYVGELGELMVAYLAQQARALRRLQDLAQG